jgi:hypothetical protein
MAQNTAPTSKFRGGVLLSGIATRFAVFQPRPGHGINPILTRLLGREIWNLDRTPVPYRAENRPALADLGRSDDKERVEDLVFGHARNPRPSSRYRDESSNHYDGCSPSPFARSDVGRLAKTIAPQ